MILKRCELPMTIALLRGQLRKHKALVYLFDEGFLLCDPLNPGSLLFCLVIVAV